MIATPPGIDRWPTDLMTVGRSLRIAATRQGGKLAVADPRGSLTYCQLDERANRFAQALIARGVKPGEHVGILFDNTVEHVVSIYGVARAGAVSVVLDVKWVGREIVEALGLFDCTCLIHDESHPVQLGAEADALLPHGRIGFHPRSSGASEFDRLAKSFPADEPDVLIGDDDVFMIMLTSGTTGVPKGCIKTHKSYWYSAAAASMTRRITPRSRELIVVPIYYNSGRMSLISQLWFGGSVYLRERFDPVDVLAIIEREKITCIALAPTQCRALLECPDLDKYDKSSLEMLRKAGLPFAKRDVEDIMARITPHLFQAYGGTEFSNGTVLRPEDQIAKLGSAGRPEWSTEVEVVGADRRSLPTGEQGEVRVRGPSVVNGYYNNEAANRACFIDGWYYSGDLGYLDEDGYLYITGRAKEIIKTGGINVAPREVEDVILSFPGSAGRRGDWRAGRKVGRDCQGAHRAQAWQRAAGGRCGGALRGPAGALQDSAPARLRRESAAQSARQGDGRVQGGARPHVRGATTSAFRAARSAAPPTPRGCHGL